MNYKDKYLKYKKKYNRLVLGESAGGALRSIDIAQQNTELLNKFVEMAIYIRTDKTLIELFEKNEKMKKYNINMKKYNINVLQTNIKYEMVDDSVFFNVKQLRCKNENGFPYTLYGCINKSLDRKMFNETPIPYLGLCILDDSCNIKTYNHEDILVNFNVEYGLPPKNETFYVPKVPDTRTQLGILYNGKTLEFKLPGTTITKKIKAGDWLIITAKGQVLDKIDKAKFLQIYKIIG